jgi:hypothetical protein
MHDYTPNDDFPVTRLLDTSDPVQGGTGASGISNEPLFKLADRTEYLFNRLGRYLGHRVVTADALITATDVGKLVQPVKNINMTLSLDTIANFKVGQWVDIKAKITATANSGKSVLIQANGAEAILNGNSILNTAPFGLYLCDGDMVRLVACDANADDTPDYWEAHLHIGNYDKIGIDQLVRFRPKNTIVANGCNPEILGPLLLRDDYSRLAALVLPTAIDDASWLAEIRFRQFWSTGDGSSTMRPPDMRSMVHKGLDLGRGLSLTRMDDVPGGLELDAVKSHDHSIPEIPLYTPPGDVDRGGSTSKFSIDNVDITKRTGSTGGVENLIKTTGFIPVIYY